MNLNSQQLGCNNPFKSIKIIDIMKKIIMTAFLLCILSITGKAQFIGAELEVSGLTCSMCSLSTQKSLNTLDFIGLIKPDLNKNIFYIQFKPGKIVNLDAIRQKVVSAGFSVSKLIAIYNFNNLKISDRFIYAKDGATYEFIDGRDQLLEGSTRLQVIDKGFVSGKILKKYSAELNPVFLAGTPNTELFDKSNHHYHVSLSK